MDTPKVLSFAVPLMLLSVSIGGCAMGAGDAPDSASQQAPTASEAHRQVTLDDDAVRVVESTYPVGAATSTHTHDFPRVLYVIAGGTLQATGSDGATDTRNLKPGDTLWLSPETHSTRNIGSTTVRILEVEVKGKTEDATELPGSATD